MGQEDELITLTFLLEGQLALLVVILILSTTSIFTTLSYVSVKSGSETGVSEPQMAKRSGSGKGNGNGVSLFPCSWASSLVERVFRRVKENVSCLKRSVRTTEVG